MAISWEMIERNPELKKQLSLLFQLMGEEEGHKQGVKDREAKGELNPAKALGQPSSSSSMQRSSSALSMADQPGLTVPQHFIDNLHKPGWSDPLTEPYSVPDPAIGQAMGDINQTYQTGIAGAQAQANEGFNLGKMTTMEKVFGGLGVVGAGMAAFGGHPKAAGTMMGMGLGAVTGAPGTYSQRQDRTLKNRLGELGATYNAEMAPLLADQGQFTAEQGVLGENKENAYKMAPWALKLGEFGLKASEQDMRKKGQYSGSGSAENLSQMSARLIEGARTGGRITQDEAENIARQYALKQIGGVPLGLAEQFGGDYIPQIPEDTGISEAGIRRGRSVADKRVKKAKLKVRQLIAKENRALSDNWISGVVSNEDIIDAARNGDLRVGGNWTGIDALGAEKVENTDLIQALTEYEQWNDPSFIQQWLDDPAGYRGEFPEVKQPIKGEATYRALGIPDPPPNDGSMTPQEYEQFKRRWPEIYKSQR